MTDYISKQVLLGLIELLKTELNYEHKTCTHRDVVRLIREAPTLSIGDITDSLKGCAREVYAEALDRYGIAAQREQLFEEMGELTVALSKYRRGRGSLDQIAEELADVSIMLEQIMQFYDCADSVIDWRRKKLTRLKNNLEESQ